MKIYFTFLYRTGERVQSTELRTKWEAPRALLRRSGYAKAKGGLGVETGKGRNGEEEKGRSPAHYFIMMISETDLSPA